jgi:hypothetical protein
MNPKHKKPHARGYPGSASAEPPKRPSSSGANTNDHVGWCPSCPHDTSRSGEDDVATVRKQILAWTPQHSGGWRGQCCENTDEGLAALDRIESELLTLREALERILGLGDYWGNEGKGLGQYFRDVEETARATLLPQEPE